MLQTMSMPLEQQTAAAYGGWSGLEKTCRELGLAGLEGIWNGFDMPEDIPAGLVTGYHLTFWPDWLDFWRGDRKALHAKFGSDDCIRQVYGSLDPTHLLELYRQDLCRAVRLGARYVVFHVSDVSIEEGYSYRWLHSDRDVIDASLEVINELVRDLPDHMEFLVENQWWPGFTFTDPAMTDRLLSGIRCSRAGIMLDTGHLMNCRRSLRTQKEAAAFICRQLERHGALARAIRGVHLHQSLSGKYAAKTVGKLPPPPGNYLEQFGESYRHITRIDRHRPWTDPVVRDLVCRIDPAYLTHELSALDPERKLRDTARQMALLK